MNKKKVAALLVAGVLAVGAIGGSFAWFTSSDTKTNNFETAGKADPDDPNGADAGVKVDEIFGGDKDTNTVGGVLPGVEVNKDVRVQSTATYDQYIRVKFEKSFENEKLDDNLIHLNFKSDAFGENGTWVDGGDGYYYYKVIVKPQNDTDDKDVTTYLLDSVTLASTAGNEYKNAKYSVNVIAEGIQATPEAVKEAWKMDVDTWTKITQTDTTLQ